MRKPNVSRRITRLCLTSASVGLLMLCLYSLSFGTTGTAIDIPVATIGPYSDLTRNASWGVAGQNGIENSWIIQPLTPQTLTCIYIANNNPTNAHSFTLTFRSTGDPRVTGYLSKSAAIQAKWNLVFTQAGSVPALGVQTYSFGSQTAARAQIQVTGTATAGGVPDTGDIYIVQSTTSCGPATVNSVPVAVTITGTQTVIISGACNLSATATVATATTVLLVAAPGAGNFIHVCAFTEGGDVVTNGNTVDFDNGTAGTCAAVGAVRWQVSPHTGGGNFNVGAGFGQLFQTSVANQPLCVVAGVIGANQVVSISYMVGP